MAVVLVDKVVVVVVVDVLAVEVEVVVVVLQVHCCQNAVHGTQL